MSADCCCPNDGGQNGCDKVSISACCLPSGSCVSTTECDCLEKGGKWLAPVDDGTGTNTFIPTPCSSCFVCKCCQAPDESGANLYKGLGPAKQTAIFARGDPCPPETTRVSNYAYDPTTGCRDVDCNVPCDQTKGTCCYDCGCAEGVTRCDCASLIRQSGSSGTAFGTSFFVGGTCDTVCEHCACIEKTLRTYPSGKCRELNNGYIVSYRTDGDSRAPRGSGTSCEEIAAADPVGFVQIAQSCAQSGGPSGGGGGGGGGGGPPVTPPTPPRPPQPPTPPQPCTRPAAYNPTCAYKVWFSIVTERYENFGTGYVRETINLWRLPDFTANSCDTLGCCGAPVPNCNDAGTITTKKTVIRVTNCTFSDTDTQESDIEIGCNSQEEIYRYDYPCQPEPDRVTTTVKLTCVTAQKLRGCCDSNMGFLQFQIPELGIKENGVWTFPYYPAETITLDLRNQVCVGYDRNHPSCNKP